MKNSPNLDKFRANRRNKDFLNVYVEKSGDWRNSKNDVYIGEIFDGELNAARLCRILVGNHTVFCFMGNPPPDTLADITTEFWQLYDKIGRCAFDADHKQYYQNSEDRYTEDGGKRTCNWCGAEQIKRSKERVVIDEWWEVVK